MEYCYYNSIDEKYEAWKSEVIWPMSQSKVREEAVWLQRHSSYAIAHLYFATQMYYINLNIEYLHSISYVSTMKLIKLPNLVLV